MDAEIYAESVEYELLTQSVYRAILRREGDERIAVEHDSDIVGRSGVAHQVDVSWRFRKAGVEHRVLVECKNYGKAITLEKIRNFFAVLHDIGGCTGVMVTKTGYQSGVVEFAKHYGIDLKLLRAPRPEDWKDRIKDIHGRLHIVGLSTSPEKVPRVGFDLAVADKDELRAAIDRGDIVQPPYAEVVFVDAQGIPITEMLGTWLPKKLAEDNQPEGGPYTKEIAFKDHYIEVGDRKQGTRRIQVPALHVTYHNEIVSTREIVLNGDQIVDAILKDFSTGDIEIFHRRDE